MTDDPSLQAASLFKLCVHAPGALRSICHLVGSCHPVIELSGRHHACRQNHQVSVFGCSSLLMSERKARKPNLSGPELEPAGVRREGIHSS